ncbi:MULTISPECIES: acyl-CoA dehydrogenase family protein [unclassified Sphingobium]|uniref:acyl-CoA dehydrogenase family protein n=1 Tax=unclassified Sphingobium TaxID=2611147 RepID=UPI0035A72F0D
MAVLTEEQSILRDQARAWCQKRAPVSAYRAIRDAADPCGYDPALFAEMVEMGWTGVIAPESCGGSDFGYLSLGFILEETGRTLVASPLVASALGAGSALILGGSDEQRQRYLEPIVAGELIGALAVDEGAQHAPEQVALRAEPEGSAYRLNGTKSFVLEGNAAGLMVVSARTSGAPGEPHGITLFLVPGDAAGLTRTPLHLADGRGAADVVFADVLVGSDQVLGEVNEGAELLARVLDRVRAGLAAEMLGSTEAAFAMTLDYLKTRVQFGQLIGAFQALQHRAARMFGELELARSCVEAALAAIDTDSVDVPRLVALAKAFMGETMFLVSNELIQMHGGIGMTDAHDAGLYLKRARVCEAAFGNRAFHRERYARLNGY